MKILLLAGEESGVLYANQIRAELERRLSGAEIRGYADYGFETSDLAVMGIVPVLCRLFYFLRVKRTMETAIDRWRPDVVCTVDYPGMNLKLAAYAKRKGVKAVHVVCPQVWAWRRGRIPKIEAALDRLCCFFPFEPALFRPGFAEFVGHPLAEAFGAAETGRGLSPDGMLALLPGSRLGEIEKIFPVLIEVVRELRQKLPRLKVVVPAANDRAYAAILRHIDRSGLEMEVTHGGARQALAVADSAVVASGTATLEAALSGCPTVLVYRVGWVFAAIARRVIKGVKHVGLANIIAEKAGRTCPMPELLQENMTVGNILDCLLPNLTDATENARARECLSKTMGLLRTDGNAIARIVNILICP